MERREDASTSTLTSVTCTTFTTARAAPAGVVACTTSNNNNNNGLHHFIPARVASTQVGWFCPYKLLFAVCLALNLLCLLAAAAFHRLPYASRHPSVISLTNILVLALCRNEAFLRFIFMFSVRLLADGPAFAIPLRIKTAVTAFLQSLGGIHSGCGVSSVIWLSYDLANRIAARRKHNNTPMQLLIGFVSGVLALLVATCVAACPPVRHRHHNVFERVHRFAGWTSLALVWAFVILSDSYDQQAGSYRVHAKSIVTKAEFWLTALVTFMIILPWLCVRRVPVQTTVPSDSLSVIKFRSAGIRPGILGRISRSPFSEWHAFGIVSDGVKDHLIVAGAVGDFTKELVRNPPTHLWVRCVAFAGLPYLANMYNRVLCVATGSGIGVFLSFLLQPTSAEVYLIWIAKHIEKTFGAEIYEMVSKYPAEKLHVYDTALHQGRPNIKQMVVDTAQSWRAEVVIVTSNPSGSKDVLDACRRHGIPAFGPIWDS